MSRFRIQHPSSRIIHGEAGHDATLGFYVDVMKGHRVVSSYDRFHPSFNRQRPLMGCLGFLMREGFFTEGQLHDALVFLQDGAPKPRDFCVVEIVTAFKQA